MPSRTGQRLRLLNKAVHQLMTLRRQPSQLLALQTVLRLAQPIAQLDKSADLAGVFTD